METPNNLNAPQWRSVAETLAGQRNRWVRFVQRRIPADVEAEEIVHHALLRALAQIGTLEEPSRASAWFFQILRRAIADALRVRAKVVPDDAMDKHVERGSDQLLPETGVSCACIQKLMHVLRPEYANVLSQVVLEGATLREAAESLATTENNAAVRLHRARAALRREIQECCGVTSFRACLDCMCDIDGTCARPHAEATPSR